MSVELSNLRYIAERLNVSNETLSEILEVDVADVAAYLEYKRQLTDYQIGRISKTFNIRQSWLVAVNMSMHKKKIIVADFDSIVRRDKIQMPDETVSKDYVYQLKYGHEVLKSIQPVMFMQEYFDKVFNQCTPVYIVHKQNTSIMYERYRRFVEDNYKGCQYIQVIDDGTVLDIIKSICYNEGVLLADATYIVNTPPLQSVGVDCITANDLYISEGGA